MPDYPIIDAHVHTYPTPEIGRQAMMGFGRSDYSGTVDELLDAMARGGIQRAVMVNMTPVADMRDAALARLPQAQRQAAAEDIRRQMIGRLQRRNAWTCQVAQEHPELIPFIGLDVSMTREELRQEIEERFQQGARGPTGGDRRSARLGGIKLHPANQRFYPHDRRLWPAYERAQELGLPIIFHSGIFLMDSARDDFAQPRHFAEVLSSFPRLTAVLAHLSRGFFDDAAALARSYSNLFFDSCAAINGTEDPPTLSDDEAVAVIRKIGADRIMFGSDYPWFDPVRDAARIQRLPLSEGEKRAILFENAQRILGL